MINRFRQQFGMAGLALMLGVTPALASVTISVAQNKAVKARAQNGVVVERVIPMDTAVPGDIVVYRYTVHNGGARNADGVVINTAIPENMIYRAYSAVQGTARASVLLSADGGRSYAPENELMVFDIDETWRPARAEDVTHLRWTLHDAVMPTTAEVVEYRAMIK